MGEFAQTTLIFSKNVAMGKYRKDKITLGNVLKVVEALLTLADEEISIPGDKLKATFKLEWVKEDELRVSGKVEQKLRNKIQTSEKGITKDDLWTLTECIGKTLEISPSLDGTKKDSPEKKKQAVQDVLDCLTDLKLLEDKRPHGKNDKSGYWKFHLKLKHQTADKKDNLKVIKDKWADNIGSVPDLELATPAEKPIDWREICTNLLNEEAQRRQATGYGMGHEVDIYVPLGLVKPKQQPRRSGENPDSTQGMQQYQLQGENEIEKRYAYQDFLDRVIAKADKNLAIIGEPGAGKSTWLQQIVQYLSTREVFLIWIPLANLGDFTLEEYLLNRWLKDAFSLLEPTTAQKQALVDLFNSGKVWLLLDGVDEMKTANPLTQISKSLTGWVNKARVVLTCRLNVWEANPNTLPKFDTYRTLCFEGEQVNDFISQWFEKKEKPELGKQLQEKLATAESARIFDLVKNPLRLSLLCKAWLLNPGILPTTQADLYQQIRDDFYVWKQQEFPTSLDERQELNRRFAKLAFRAIAENRPLHQSFVYSVLEQKWFKLAEDLGWLNFVYRDIRNDEPIYAFFHLTFQEYFAALAVDDWDDFVPRNHVNFPVPGKECSENLSFPRRRESTIPGRKPQYRIFQPQWKQVILFWLGRSDVTDQEKFNKEKEEFIEKLVNFNDGVENFYGYRSFFLAAAGISEFKTCSLGDAIVKQIVQWGFGYYDQEEQEWHTFLDSSETGAREILPQTDRKRTIRELCQIVEDPQLSEYPLMQAAESLGEIDPRNQMAIAALIKVLETTKDEDTRRQVAKSLGEIGQGNETAIAALVKLLETTKNEFTRWLAAKSLGEIGQGNQTAIALLVKVVETTEDEFTRWLAARSLGDIGQGNETAIAALVKVIETTDDEDTRRETAYYLGFIDPGNQTAIAALVKVIETTDNEDTRWLAASCLGKIDPGNETAIAALIKVIATTKNEYTRGQAAYSLGEIGQDNEMAIAALVRILETTEDEDTHRRAASCLGKIDPGNETAIAALVRILETTEDEYTRMLAAEILGEIGQGNETAIAALVKVIETTDNEDTRWQAASSLGKIEQGNETAIAALAKVIETTKDEDTCWQAAYSLGEIDPGNQTAIAALVKIIYTNESVFTRGLAAEGLGKIIITDEHRKTVVTTLQPYLNHETYENNFDLWTNCYKILWKIAQDLPYPDFYHAWHGETSPLVQNLELAQLPRNLQTQLSETNLNQTVQVFYIDGSKFIGDDPAKTIYRQMTQQGGRKIEDKPKNMADLQDYWADLIDENDQPPVLILYQDPSNGTAQGFSETFLDLLTRFDGIICLITDQTHPPLQTFSPQYPQLIHNIVAWLQRRILEM
ncbi:HEAT repeat domain-containing protein [Planktothricoides raciborskii]|uniref:HEAT repeat domain-containing protein n=1 Tax=Planktothricoides raciborskii GIHE-MW2 TaxID=2792601 RepID=A0AAU8JDN9_9CYAN